MKSRPINPGAAISLVRQGRRVQGVFQRVSKAGMLLYTTPDHAHMQQCCWREVISIDGLIEDRSTGELIFPDTLYEKLERHSRWTWVTLIIGASVLGSLLIYVGWKIYKLYL